jgi:hypothetical protein
MADDLLKQRRKSSVAPLTAFAEKLAKYRTPDPPPLPPGWTPAAAAPVKGKPKGPAPPAPAYPVETLDALAQRVGGRLGACPVRLVRRCVERLGRGGGS